MIYNSLSAHTSEFTGVSSFNNGKCLRPEVYKEWRLVLFAFLAISGCMKLNREERDFYEPTIGGMLYSGLYREIVKNQNEYYLLIKRFVNCFGTSLRKDITIYRSLSLGVNEDESTLGGFWTSSLDTAKSYYNGSKIYQMKLLKGTKVYHLTDDKVSRWWDESGVYKTRGCNNEEYWVDMKDMIGKEKIATQLRSRARVQKLAA